MKPEKVIEVLETFRTKLPEPRRLNKYQYDLMGDSVPNKLERQHMAWMCGEAIKFVREGRIEKAMRWLGWLNHGVYKHGFFTMNAVKRLSMPNSNEVDEGPKVNELVVSVADDDTGEAIVKFEDQCLRLPIEAYIDAFDGIVRTWERTHGYTVDSSGDDDSHDFCVLDGPNEKMSRCELENLIGGLFAQLYIAAKEVERGHRTGVRTWKPDPDEMVREKPYINVVVKGPSPEDETDTQPKTVGFTVTEEVVLPNRVNPEAVSAVSVKGVTKLGITTDVGAPPEKVFACTGLTPDSEVCWHCHDIIEARPAPRCEQCPDECDIEECEAPGCAGTRELMKTAPDLDWAPEFKPSKFYANRNPMELDKAGGYYCRHVSAMTGEGLHAKSDIAAELGARDLEIDILKREVNRWQNSGQVEGDYVPHAVDGDTPDGFFLTTREANAWQRDQRLKQGLHAPHAVDSLERLLATCICRLINDWRRAPTPKESGPMGDLLDAIETHCRLVLGSPTAEDIAAIKTEKDGVTSYKLPAESVDAQTLRYMAQARAAEQSMPQLVLDTLQAYYDNVGASYPLMLADSGEYIASRDELGEYIERMREKTALLGAAIGVPVQRFMYTHDEVTFELNPDAPILEAEPMTIADVWEKTSGPPLAASHMVGSREDVLVVSTSHVTKEEMQDIYASEYSYGDEHFTMFRIDEEGADGSPLVETLGENGRRLVEWARKVGASHIKLDSGGITLEHLPTFKW